MKFHTGKKVVIVTEASILADVTKMVTELGASGYTVISVTGRGERGAMPGSVALNDLLKNVRIDIITSEEVARKIAVEMVERFFKHYAGIVYIEDVEIIRVKKFRLYE